MAIVFAEALSACAATKFVSQISLNDKHFHLQQKKMCQQTSIIRLLMMYLDNPLEVNSEP